MAALKATSTTIWVCRHIVKTSLICVPPSTLLTLSAEPLQPSVPSQPQRDTPRQERHEPHYDKRVPPAHGCAEEIRALGTGPESLGLQRHIEDVGGADGRDEDRHQERQVLPDPLDDVPGFEVEPAGSLGLADGQARSHHRRDQPEGSRDREGEPVRYPQPDQSYPHLLVAGGGEEEHARDHGYDYAQRVAEPVEQGLPLHEEEQRRLPSTDDGPEDGGHYEDREQNKPDAPEVRQGLRQVSEEQHQREHDQLVERV